MRLELDLKKKSAASLSAASYSAASFRAVVSLRAHTLCATTHLPVVHDAELFGQVRELGLLAVVVFYAVDSVGVEVLAEERRQVHLGCTVRPSRAWQGTGG